jgi:hypothetical protein
MSNLDEKKSKAWCIVVADDHGPEYLPTNSGSEKKSSIAASGSLARVRVRASNERFIAMHAVFRLSKSSLRWRPISRAHHKTRTRTALHTVREPEK